jgi:hypothetical protein
MRRVAEASTANTATARLPDDVRQMAEDMARSRKSGATEAIGPDSRDL